MHRVQIKVSFVRYSNIESRSDLPEQEKPFSPITLYKNLILRRKLAMKTCRQMSRMLMHVEFALKTYLENSLQGDRGYITSEPLGDELGDEFDDEFDDEISEAFEDDSDLLGKE